MAKNHHKRTEQKYDSLEEWYEKQVSALGKKAADTLRSQLTVTKSYRRYNNTKRHLPGAVFLARGKIHVLKGQQNNGLYFYGEETPRVLYNRSEITFVGAKGLVYL